MRDPPRVEGGASPNDPVDCVALVQKELGQIGAILT